MPALVAWSSAALLTRFSLSLPTDHQCSTVQRMFSSSCVQLGFWLSSFMSGKAIFLSVFEAKAALPVQRRAIPHLFYLPWWKSSGFSLTPSLPSCFFGRWSCGSPCVTAVSCPRSCHTGVQSFGVLLLNLMFPAGSSAAARCLSFLPY